MQAKKRVLVVCAANLGRSPALAHYIELFAREQNASIEVKSAGVNILLIEELQRIGQGADTQPLIDRIIETRDRMQGRSKFAMKTEHAKPITPELMKWADIVISADPSITQKINHLFPNEASKVNNVKEFVTGKKIVPKERFIHGETLPESAGIKDANSRGKPKHFRRGAKQRETKAYWFMIREIEHLSKRVIERLMDKPSLPRPMRKVKTGRIPIKRYFEAPISPSLKQHILAVRRRK